MDGKILCTECYKELTDDELEAYPLQWQYSGDMYCFDCRVDPEDTREAVQ